ncbi:MAG: hypothetical protein ACTSPY_03585 [Candidatus Helarchaeota archaeon]
MYDKNENNKNFLSIIEGLELELKIKQEELKNRDKTIKELKYNIKKLKHEIFELETRIEIFQNQITPSVAESIKKYRSTINNFENIIRKKDQINKHLKEINSSLEFKIDELKTELSEKLKLITKLNNKISLIPHICDVLINELNERDVQINKITQENLLLKQKLSAFKKDYESDTLNTNDKVQELLEVIDDKNNVINFLKNQIIEQRNLISKLETSKKTDTYLSNTKQVIKKDHQN